MTIELASEISVKSVGLIGQLISVLQLFAQSDGFVRVITRPQLLGAVGHVICSKRNSALAVARFNEIPNSIKNSQPQASVNAVEP